MIFDENVYGRARGYVGVLNQFSHFHEDRTKNKTNFGIILGAGYNLYFNIYENLHPFVGIEAQGIIPTTKQRYFTASYNGIENVKRSYKEVFLTHLKLGSRFVLADWFSLSPYGLIGFNVARIEYNYRGFEKNRSTAGINVGFGGEMTIKDLFLFAIEYRYSRSDKKNAEVSNNTIAVKIGLEFL